MMTVFVATNSAAVQASGGGRVAPDARMKERPMVVLSSSTYSILEVKLSLLESALQMAFDQAPSVNALYAARDDEGVMMVFAVVAEHDDDVYEEVLAAEDRVRAQFPDEQLEVRVRARQGRPPRAAVPLTSLPLFYR